jgi:hypothetical protein
MSAHSPSKADLFEQVLHECSAMAQFALASGKSVPPALLSTIDRMSGAAKDQPRDVAALARVHDQLCKVVAPATPRALLLMGSDHAAGKLSWIGQVGVVRRMMVVAAVSLLAFLAVSIAPQVDNPNLSLIEANGWTAVLVEVWWVSAAAMGASFAMLMQVSQYIVKRNYDPKYEPSYWIRFLLGIMAGLILAALIPIQHANGSGVELGKPTIALLGGFSASAVYSILTKLVETVESIFRSSSSEEIAQRERDARVRAGEDVSQSKIAVAGQIVQLQHQIAAGASTADLSTSLQQILNSLVPPAESQSAAAGDDAPAGTIALPGIPIVSSDAPAADPADDSPVAAPAADVGDDTAAAQAATDAAAG